MDWKAVVKTVTPVLGAALGGPLAGPVLAVLGQALGVGSTEEEVAAKVVSASPEQLLALKQAEQGFQESMAKLGVDLEKVNSEDRDSARKMHMAMGDWVTPSLAIGITIGFFSLLGLTAFVELHNQQVIDILIGSLGTAWISVVTFYFGSSKGSQNKDKLLYNSTPRE